LKQTIIGLTLILMSINLQCSASALFFLEYLGFGAKILKITLKISAKVYNSFGHRLNLVSLRYFVNYYP